MTGYGAVDFISSLSNAQTDLSQTFTFLGFGHVFLSRHVRFLERPEL